MATRQSRSDSGVSMSQSNYEHCINQLQQQDARIRSLESELRRSRNDGGSTTRSSSASDDGNLNRIQVLLEMLQLQRPDQDVVPLADNIKKDQEIAKLRAENERKDAIIKDLQYSLEFQGGDKDRLVEFTKKNERLQKIVSNKEDLLAGQEAELDDLRRMVSRVRPGGDTTCPNCDICEEQLQTMDDKIVEAEANIRQLRSDNQKLVTEKRVLEYQLHDCQSQEVRPSKPTNDRPPDDGGNASSTADDDVGSTVMCPGCGIFIYDSSKKHVCAKT